MSVPARAAYSRQVVDYFTHTPHAGKPLGGDVNLFSGTAGDRERGTQIMFFARVVDGIVEQCGYQVFGCPHVIAACCLAAERLTGQPVGRLAEMAPETLIEALEVPIEKTGRILVLQDALLNCFRAWDNS